MRQKILIPVLLLILGACSSGSNSPRAVPAPPATNNDGSPVTGIITANFNPSIAVVPFPTNLLLLGTTDLTLNIPSSDPTDISNPVNAMNAIDGFSTSAPWSTGFSAAPRPESVVPGSSVRLFEVALTGPGGGVVGIVRELQPGAEYVAVASGQNVVILPTKPLPELTSFMAVVTDGITDSRGNDATPDQAYFIAKRTAPLVDAQGNSTDPLLDNATAQALEPLRQLTNSQEFAAASVGISRDDIVISWVATTQSISPVMGAVRSTTTAQTSSIVPSGLTTAAIGLNGIADIHIGYMETPYYLDAFSATNPLGPLQGRWEAAPGAYVPPFDAFGLDPTSTNVTFANPFPVVKSTEGIPVIITIPNAGSGQAKPASGWPVAIFQHGITGNRTQMLAIAETMALAGFATVAIDLPLHGVTDVTSPFYVGNTPFAAVATERTFDVDYINNDTSAPGPDGMIDGSGAHMINLQSLVTSRDNLRQASADLSTLSVTIPTMDVDLDTVPDFDGARIQIVALSLGSIVSTPFLAVEPTVSTGVLSAPGGGIPRMLEASPTFGPTIQGGLAAAGVLPGTPEYDQFFLAAQTVVDSADPINWSAAAAAGNSILIQEILGDQVIPNFVATAPLSGTEPMIAMMQLAPLTESVVDPGGIRRVARIIGGSHGSLLDPTTSFDVTVELQGEAASMFASDGLAVQVTNPQVLAQ